VVQCPNCNTVMHEQALFCPGCGMPRTHVRERLEQQAAATGVPYDQLLQQAREEDYRTRSLGGFTTPVAPPVQTPPIEQPRKSNRLWWILGGICGGFLLICVACVVVVLVARNQTGLSLGEDDAGAVVRQQLELAEQGRHLERWQLLHPAQRAAVPASDFVSCSQAFGIEEFTILWTRKADDQQIPLITDDDIRSVNYMYTWNGESYHYTDYVARDGGDWYWTLTAADIAAFRQGGCP
jgi:hypothetical protein